MVKFNTISRIKEKNLIVFIVCFILATVFWLLSNLSKTFEQDISVPLEFKNFPEDKVLTAPPPKTIGLRVSTSGWNLLSLMAGESSQELILDLSRTENNKRIRTAEFDDDFSEQIPSSYEIISISPAYIKLQLDDKARKKVAVMLDYQLELRELFDVSGPVSVQPDSIWVSGPASKIDSLKFWKTEQLIAEDVHESIERTVTLLGDFEGFSAEEEKIEAIIPISEFTEKVIETIAIELKNCESLGDVLIFPNHVKLTFLLPLDKFESIGQDLFEPYIDCESIDLEEDKYLQLNVSSTARYIKNLKVEPEFVEYILYR